MCLIPNSIADTTKDISLPCPLVLSWLCLHKFGGVYLRCQDQCWPQIDNFLGTCTLATYRSAYINLSHPPLLLVSTLLLTCTINFFPSHCEFDGLFFSLKKFWATYSSDCPSKKRKKRNASRSVLLCCFPVTLSLSIQGGGHNAGPSV